MRGKGWTTRRASVKCADTNDGTGCLSIGWDASVAEGTVTSRCNGPFCPRSGWTSKGPSGTWTVTCKQDDCQETGFVLEKSKSKTRFEATCVQHCETVGYDLVGSDGSTWACRCGAGGCWETGIYCGMTQRPTAVEADGLGGGRGTVDLELGHAQHQATSAELARIAASTRSGVNGMVLIRTPTASQMAFAMAGMAGCSGPSPASLAP